MPKLILVTPVTATWSFCKVIQKTVIDGGCGGGL